MTRSLNLILVIIYFKKPLFIHLLVSAKFSKYCIRHILCGQLLQYFGNFTIFLRNISTIFFKYFDAVWEERMEGRRCRMEKKNGEQRIENG